MIYRRGTEDTEVHREKLFVLWLRQGTNKYFDLCASRCSLCLCGEVFYLFQETDEHTI
jgi:hypothetical protein